MVGFFYYIHFLLLGVFYKYISLTIFLLQATVRGCEPSLMELFVETHVQSDDRQKMV
jgi:hypothetical protein